MRMSTITASNVPSRGGRGVLAARRGFDLMPAAGEVPLERDPHRRFIVHHEHPQLVARGRGQRYVVEFVGAARHHDRQLHDESRARRSGAFSAQIRPSCSRTMPSEIDSPNPVPDPVGLVVKNGLKIRSMRFGGMPRPGVFDFDPDRVAVAAGAHGEPLGVRCRCSIACSALVMRFRNTCCSWCASAIVSGSASS